MCTQKRLFPDGRVEEASCPGGVLTSREEYQKLLFRLARANPDMTIGKLAEGLHKSVWWVFERVTETLEHEDEFVTLKDGRRMQRPREGDKFRPYVGGPIWRIARTNKNHVVWESEEYPFSYYEDLIQMERVL